MTKPSPVRLEVRVADQAIDARAWTRQYLQRLFALGPPTLPAPATTPSEPSEAA